MLITVNRTYDVEWLDNWGETGWHLFGSYRTLEYAIKYAKEANKKHYTIRIMIVDTPTDSSFAKTYKCYRDWKD